MTRRQVEEVIAQLRIYSPGGGGPDLTKAMNALDCMSMHDLAVKLGKLALSLMPQDQSGENL